MVNYRRNLQEGATYFFTVTLQNRQSTLLVNKIHFLRKAMKQVMQTHFYTIDGIVILPDHIHTIWTLPEGDSDYPLRWKKIKTAFTKSVQKEGLILEKTRHGEARLWQRRYWEHTIRDEYDLACHLNYLHYNPVKHGLVEAVKDWPYSSFHSYIKRGILSVEWGDERDDDIRWDVGE